MKFVKTVIDGKEYYRMLGKDENINEEKSGNAEETIVEGEVVDGDADGEVNYTEKLNDILSEASDNMRELGGKLWDGAKDLGGKLWDGAKDLGKKVKEGTERIFTKDKSTDPASAEARLIRLLPYMDAASVHEIAEKLIKNDSTMKNIDIASILPFFTVADCDALFLSSVLAGNDGFEPEKVMPYVSAECLGRVVDNYIAGKCPNLDIDSLYPYLSNGDIKRIFYHIINSAG